MIVPLIVMALAFYISLSKLGMLGTKFGLILAYTPLTLPFSVLPISATLRGFDRSLEHAALSLGASRFQTFTRITFPIIRPGILTGGHRAVHMRLHGGDPAQKDVGRHPL